MSNLFGTDDAAFEADVAALQAAYEQRCKERELDPQRGSAFPTAQASGARGDWAFNPAELRRR